MYFCIHTYNIDSIHEIWYKQTMNLELSKYNAKLLIVYIGTRVLFSSKMIVTVKRKVLLTARTLN